MALSLAITLWIVGELTNSALGQDIPDEPNPFEPILALDTGGHNAAVYKVLVSEYKNQLISVGLDKTIRLWDLQTGEPLRVLRPAIGPDAHGCLLSAALSPDDRLLAVGTYRAMTPLYDHRIHLIDVESGKIIRSLKGHTYTIYDLAFSKDGKKLASSSHDSTLRIWDVETGKTLQILKGHTGPVHGVAWKPDGTQVVSGGDDKTARIWSTESGASLAVLRDHQAEIWAVDWSPDGRTIATGSYDKSIRLYEPSGKFRFAWRQLPNQVMSLKFAPDSSRLLYTYGSNSVPPVGANILDMEKGKQLVHYDGHDNSVLCCAFSKDGKTAVTGDVISRIRVWDYNTGATRLRLDGRGSTKFSAGWSPDGQAISWGSREPTETNDVGGPLDRTFCFKNLDFGPPPNQTFIRPRARIGDLSMGYDVSENPINSHKLIFVRSGQEIASFTIPDPFDEARCYTLYPDQRAVVGTFRASYLYDVKSKLVQRKMSDRGEQIWGVAPSPNNRYVLTAANDQIVRVWNLDEGTMVVALFVAGDEWIAWTPHGYYAASPAGESLMGWHVNRGAESLSDFYPAAQFHKSLYRPDVIRRLLETGDLEKAVELADRERNETTKIVKVADVLPAVVKITESSTRTEQSSSKTKIRATAEPTNKQVVSSMQLMVNGRPYGASRPIAPPPDGTTPAPVEQEWELDDLPAGSYDVAVKAEAAHNYALSPSVEISKPQQAGDPLPRLFVLSIGDGPQGKAAQEVSQAMSAGGKEIFSEVVTEVLPGDRATPDAVSAALHKIQSRSTLADTTLIYYAGQEILDTGGNYRLSAARGGNNDPVGVWHSDKALKRDLAAISGRLIFAVDTTHAANRQDKQANIGFCGSSQVESSTGKLETAADDFVRELIGSDYGVVMMRSSRTASASGSSGGSSSFSQALVEGLSGKADIDGDGQIQLPELTRYVQRRVSELTKGAQIPTVEQPRGVRSAPLAKSPPASPASKAPRKD